MGRKHASKTLNREEVVWGGTWKCPRSTGLAMGSAGALRKLRHINQKRQFGVFLRLSHSSKALLSWKSILFVH